jgi:pimeloyl-ACP methyl ester carboxylesterase
MVQEGWADNNGVRIHYFDTGSFTSSKHAPVVFVPGALTSAKDYLGAAMYLAPRRCIALSLRGRGQSDAPTAGYSLRDQMTDIEAVVEQSGLDVFCLAAYSLGVPCAISYAVCHPEHLSGFIVGDFPACYPALSPDWEKRVASAFSRSVKPHVIHALQQESSEELLWDELDGIECSVLILRGGQPDSLLTAEDGEEYRRHLRYAEVVVFEESGHVLWEPQPEQFVDTIREFLDRVDQDHL